ncbi:MAG: fused MFS/spermidine synthase [Flavobacteriales bacterium]|nr:fused MFS/spermidine synthase [Flavobacteriales bacterium]
MALLWRLFSYVWPVRVRRVQGRYQPLELTYEMGRPVLNSLHANQSFGSLHRLWQQVLRQALPADRHLDKVLVLGFGAGSVASILHHEMQRPVSIVGVEGDPAVLRLARERLRPYDQTLVELVQQDAFDWSDKTPASRFDLVVVDLFVELDVPEAAAGPAFIKELRDRVGQGGVLAFNTIAHDDPSRQQSSRIEEELRLQFSTVRVLALEEVNRVFIAL